MLQRLRSAIYGAPDLAKAKAFYAGLLGKAPYFDQPFYVGFDVDGFELGLDPEGKPSASPVAYWRVAALQPVIDRAVALGARQEGEIHDVGGGITMARLIDPVGNHLGIMVEGA